MGCGGLWGAVGSCGRLGLTVVVCGRMWKAVVGYGRLWLNRSVEKKYERKEEGVYAVENGVFWEYNDDGENSDNGIYDDDADGDSGCKYDYR